MACDDWWAWGLTMWQREGEDLRVTQRITKSEPRMLQNRERTTVNVGLKTTPRGFIMAKNICTGWWEGRISVVGITGSVLPQIPCFGKRAVRKCRVGGFFFVPWWHRATEISNKPELRLLSNIVQYLHYAEMDEWMCQKMDEQMDGWSDRGPYPGCVSGQ